MALILAVDPERREAHTIARIAAELRDCEVVAASCEEAMAIFDRRLPRVVLLPSLLPETDEQTVLASLRAHPGGGDVPVLTMPLLRDEAAAPQTEEAPNRWFSWGGGASADAKVQGCDAREFAAMVREYFKDDDEPAGDVAAAPTSKQAAAVTAAPAGTPAPLTVEATAPAGPGMDPFDAAVLEAASAAVAESIDAEASPLSLTTNDRRARVRAAAHAAASWARARRASWPEHLEPALTFPPAASARRVAAPTAVSASQTAPSAPSPSSQPSEPSSSKKKGRNAKAEKADAAPTAVESSAPAERPKRDPAPPVAATGAATASPAPATSSGVRPAPTSERQQEPLRTLDVSPVAEAHPSFRVHTPLASRAGDDDFAGEDFEPDLEAEEHPASAGGWRQRLTLAAAAVLIVAAAGVAYWWRTPAKTGLAVLESVPSESQVIVDGKDLGSTPASATLPEGSHSVEFRMGKAVRTVSITVPAGGRAIERVDWSKKPTGSLSISSQPEAKVIVDGTPRGTSPVVLDAIPVGTHNVILNSDAGSVRRTITIEPGEAAEIDETIYPGWVTITSPFEVAIIEGSRALPINDSNQVMLPPGPHLLRVENTRLGFREMRQVSVEPGVATQVSIAPPRSVLSITASAPAEVWLDGTRIGDTPLDQVPVDLGTREVVLKSAAGERKISVTITAKPTTLSVDFDRPSPVSPSI